MDYKIEYSNTELKQNLEHALDELHIFRYDNTYRTTLGNAFLDKLTEWEQNIRKYKDSPFTIVVAGDFKRGKSTLINALLGEEVVTTDVTTETVTLNRISYGLPGNEGILAGGRCVRLSNEDLKRENLEKLMIELGEPIQRLELKRPCELLKKITIIDTPGTGDAMKDFSPLVKDSLIQADAVIYVYNVQYPLSRSEQMFIKASLLPQKYTSLFLVGNYSDILGTPEAYSRMEALLKQRVENLLPGATPYMISALDELCFQLGESVRETALTPVLRGRFQTLRRDLEALIASRADTVVTDRMQRLTFGMVQELETELDALEQGLSMSIQDASAALQDAKKKQQDYIATHDTLLKNIDAVIHNMKIEANAWMSDFLQRIIQETEQLSAISNDDLKRYYEFYCIDLMQEAMNTCIEYHQDCLFDLIDQLGEGVRQKTADALPHKKMYNFRLSLDNRIWTKGDTVGLVTSYMGALNILTGLTSIVTDGISGMIREKEKQTRIPELMEQISHKLQNMSATISRTIEEIYHELGTKTKNLLVDYYEEQLQLTRHLCEQTAHAAGKNAAEKESMKEMIQNAKTILHQLKVWA